MSRMSASPSLPCRPVTATLGFPRIGAQRELTWALERHWRGDLDAAGLLDVAADLRAHHWQLQAGRGIDRIPCGDFSLYDQVLDTAIALGAVPERFGAPLDPSTGRPDALAQYFTMARGADGGPALELTKWFDTNYHYLVPELAANQRFTYTGRMTAAAVTESAALGFATTPVILGPITFLRLSKRIDGGPTITLLDAVLPAYEAWLSDLIASGATSIQIDELALVRDLTPDEFDGYRQAFSRLRAAAGSAELILTTYFGGLDDNTALALRDEVIDLEAAGLPIVQVDEPALRETLPLRRADWGASLTWATDAFRLATSGVRADTAVHTHLCYAEFGDIMDAVIALGADRLWVNPDCGLKTRACPGVESSLRILVASAQRARAQGRSRPARVWLPYGETPAPPALCSQHRAPRAGSARSPVGVRSWPPLASPWGMPWSWWITDEAASAAA